MPQRFARTLIKDIRPGLFLVSATCGAIDAACLLTLGGVFAEMMTGNLMLMAVAVGSGGKITHAERFLWPLIAFAIGSIAGGRLMRHREESQDRLIGFSLVWATIALSALICWYYEPNGHETLGRAVTALLAMGMGIQTALLRRHGVPDIAINVMTLTMNAVLADSRLAGGNPRNSVRRMISIACFVSGGILSAFLVKFGTYWSLGLALFLYSIALPPLFHGVKPEDAAIPVAKA
jgi:uncharacterized membrane protein YoaK (UPF0700 family)